MLSEIIDLAAQRNAEAIVCSGDFFHVKNPAKNSHAMIQQLMGILGQPRCPIYVIPGNHDMGPEGIASLHEQPLGVLHQSKHLFILQSDTYTPTHHIVTESGVRIVPRAYNERLDAVAKYYALHPKHIEHNGPTIVVAHGSIVPPGVQREYPTVEAGHLDWTGIDVIASGHIHEDLGTIDMRSGRMGVFTNVGSLGRTAYTEANRTRTVKIVSVHDGRDVEEIPLKTAYPQEPDEHTLLYGPTHGILWDVEVKDEKEPDVAMGEFVARLQATALHEEMDIRELAAGLVNLDEPTRQRLIAYIEEAEYA